MQYQPPANKYNLSIEYSNAKTTVSANDVSDGSQVFNSNINSDTVNALFGYGVTKYFAVGLGVGAAFISNNVISEGSQVQNLSSPGVTNPYLMGQYRVQEQDEHLLNIDVLLSYAPNIGTAKSASSQSNGNQIRGGDLTTVGVTVGRKYDSISYAVSASAMMYGSAITTNASTNVQSQTSAYDQLDISAAIQWRKNEWISLLGLINYDQFPSVNIITLGEAPAATGSYNQMGIEAAVLVSIVPKKYVVKLDYQEALPTTVNGTIDLVSVKEKTHGSSSNISLLAEF